MSIDYPGPTGKLPGKLKHIETQDQLYSTADGDDLAGSKAILLQCRKKLEEERRALERKTKINPEFVQDHPYFRLGVIDALKWVISLPGEARQFINSKERS